MIRMNFILEMNRQSSEKVNSEYIHNAVNVFVCMTAYVVTIIYEILFERYLIK